MTSILFNLGKILLSFYFGAANPDSTYGAAGSVVLILLWVSYSCLILFFGAAFTRIYTEKYESEILPEDFAMKVVTEEIIVEKGCDNPPEEKEESSDNSLKEKEEPCDNPPEDKKESSDNPPKIDEKTS